MRSILVRVCRQNRFGTLRTGLGDWIAGMTPIRILEVPTVREQTHEGHPRWRASVGPGVGAPSRAGGMQCLWVAQFVKLVVHCRSMRAFFRVANSD